MMGDPMKCRVPVEGELGSVASVVDCGKDAAVGLVTVSIDLSKREIVELNPLCEEHAPETIHEVTISMNADEWAVITLAYGASGGDLR
jgi:hypothetical protein